MADAEQQHLPVQLVDAPHRAVDAVRDLDRVRGGDARRRGPAAAKECGLSLRRTPGCRQKVSATTPISSMQGVDRGSKGVLIVPRHAGHHQRARGAQGSLEGGDQSGRAALHRFDLREGAVDEQHAARLNTEGVELGDQLGLRNGLLWHEGIISQTPPEPK